MNPPLPAVPRPPTPPPPSPPAPETLASEEQPPTSNRMTMPSERRFECTMMLFGHHTTEGGRQRSAVLPVHRSRGERITEPVNRRRLEFLHHLTYKSRPSSCRHHSGVARMLLFSRSS